MKFSTARDARCLWWGGNGNERQATRGRRGKATYLGDRILAAVHEACASAEQRGQVSERIGRAETKRSKGGGERERERERKLTCHHKSTKSPEASFGNAPSTAPSRARQSLPRRQPKRELWPNDSSFFPVFFLGGAVSGVKGL